MSHSRQRSARSLAFPPGEKSPGLFDLVPDEVPPSVPDRRLPTAEEVEEWIAELPL
jgi:hypothetical protein